MQKQGNTRLVLVEGREYANQCGLLISSSDSRIYVVKPVLPALLSVIFSPSAGRLDGINATGDRVLSSVCHSVLREVPKGNAFLLQRKGSSSPLILVAQISGSCWSKSKVGEKDQCKCTTKSLPFLWRSCKGQEKR